MDAFELLKKDHKKVSQLFKEIEAASGQTKKQIFARLKTELDVHANVEERIFYPALENKEEARDITLEAYEEHKVVKDLLGELESSNAPEDEWDAKLTVLKENVEHHVEEEEGELFSKARQALSKQEIEELGVEMEAEKASQLGVPARSKTNTRSENSRSTAATKPRRVVSKESKTQSPGVLARLANLVGLGSRNEKSGAKPRSAAKGTKPAASKKSGKKSKAANGAGKKQSSKSNKSSKKATKKTATKSTKSSPSRAATGKRGATKKPAVRGGAAKKSQGRTNSKRGRSR
jgi:iron-sulfur cluster repair protein YtfE (RIC family)